MRKLHLDFETRSEVTDLDKTGVYLYSRHPSTDVWCAAWALDDGPVQVWRPEDPLPDELYHALADPDTVVCGHNVAFEWHIIEHVCAPRYGWPTVPFERLDCTAVRAAVQSLPRNLAGAAKALNLSVDKDDAGRRLMLQMCKPRSPRKGEDQADGPFWFDDEDRRRRLEEYCRQDVEVERQLDDVLQPLSSRERKLWLLDQRVNHRGVQVDLDLVREADSVLQESIVRYGEELSELTDGALDSVTQVEPMKEWLGEQLGREIDTLDKQAVSGFLSGREVDPLPDNVRRVLEIRQEAAKSSTAKLRAFLRRTDEHGRMRENLLHHGAGTGRWSGRGVQLQNMPRPTLSKRDIERAVRILKDTSRTPRQRAELIEWLIGPVPSVVSSCLRACVTAAPGHKLLVSDFSNIEGRVNAWAAGQDDKVEVFRNNGPVYERMAAAIYGIPVESITKDSEERHLGKTAELGCGYQMGPDRFHDTCLEAGIDVSRDMAATAVETFREVNHKIKDFWYGMERAALEAMRTPGSVSEYRYFQFHCTPDSSFLLMILPGGRRLYYPQPRLSKQKTPWGEVRDQITYMGIHQQTRQWTRLSTYGGKLVENAVQAVARDMLATAMWKAERAGLRVVLTVHDEIACEVPEDSGLGLRDLEAIMEQVPSFAAGCPVAVEGYEGERFAK